VTDIRARSLDPVLMRENWLEAHDFVTMRGRVFLDDYARSANPFASVGDRTVSVEVTSVVRASDTSFQVKWTETAYERGGLAGTSRWTAILGVTVRPPKTADTLRKNPLGLYVDAIDWSRELETSADRPAPMRPPANLPFGSPLDPNPGTPANLPFGSPLDPNPGTPAQPQPETLP
jgi:type IV secretion system protein VirB5